MTQNMTMPNRYVLVDKARVPRVQMHDLMLCSICMFILSLVTTLSLVCRVTCHVTCGVMSCDLYWYVM